MSNLDKIQKNQKEILIGEIGAMLHDIGKAHPDFIRSHCLEEIKGLPHHARDIDKLLKSELIELLKKTKININNEEKTIYDLILLHHNAKGNILTYLASCDRLQSADDKGSVRRKQPLDNVVISSPFGFNKEKIDFGRQQKLFDDLQDYLIGWIQFCLNGSSNTECFRKCLINNLKTTFSHSLGETRIPSNDVTLWDHAFSTAAVFKSILCAIALGETPDFNKITWSVLGFCWDGVGFINKGRKIADILERNKIIEDIKRQLEDKFENEIPIGNVIYEDNNGIYFTFPTFPELKEELDKDKRKQVAKECAEYGLKIIRENSYNEIFPFFTLSKPSRALTTIADELRFASTRRNIPKMSPVLFIKDKENRIEEKIDDDPDMPPSNKDEDICPVCRIRPKPEKEERCDVCEKRKEGRLTQWLKDRENTRENTIWTEEVADKNNRLALLTLNFDLDKWLDGTMIETIFSQSFEDWFYGKKTKTENKINIEKSNQQILKDAGITEVIEPTKEKIYWLLDKVIDSYFKKKDPIQAASILDTFFQDVNIKYDKNDFIINFENIISKIRKPLTVENLATFLFTQNPSPARLYRIWNETEEFFDLAIKEIKENLSKCKRIKFNVDNKDLDLPKNTPLIIKIKDLEPNNLLVFHTSNGEFYTIESLDKFRIIPLHGIKAVELPLIYTELTEIYKEDDTNNNLLKNNQTICVSKTSSGEPNLTQEDYYPLIEITKSPLSLRLIIPADISIKILKRVTDLYNTRFKKVLGKLPLNIGLLVAKRKFPLYVLFDSAERFFHSKEFKEPIKKGVWWDTYDHQNDKYYGYYPTNNEEITLDNLEPISKDKDYYLYPGYFDFDMILGTQDRFNIIYKNKNRDSKDYILFSHRPYFSYQLPQIIDLWNILVNNLANSQIKFIEESLTTKLQEWRNINEGSKDEVFNKFAKATIIDAFSKKWDKLKNDDQDFILNSAYNGLLLDTIILFKHTIKDKEENE